LFLYDFPSVSRQQVLDLLEDAKESAMRAAMA